MVQCLVSRSALATAHQGTPALPAPPFPPHSSACPASTAWPTQVCVWTALQGCLVPPVGHPLHFAAGSALQATCVPLGPTAARLRAASVLQASGQGRALCPAKTAPPGTRAPQDPPRPRWPPQCALLVDGATVVPRAACPATQGTWAPKRVRPRPPVAVLVPRGSGAGKARRCAGYVQGAGLGRLTQWPARTAAGRVQRGSLARQEAFCPREDHPPSPGLHPPTLPWPWTMGPSQGWGRATPWCVGAVTSTH